MPAPHCSVFTGPRRPSCRPTNSVRALTALCQRLIATLCYITSAYTISAVYRPQSVTHALSLARWLRRSLSWSVAAIDATLEVRVHGSSNHWEDAAGIPVASLPASGPCAPPSSRTGPLARKYLPGFPYLQYSSSRRLRQKISSTVICNYPSAAQEQPFTVGLFLLVFVRSCTGINHKIISFKNLFHHSKLRAPQEEKKSGGPGHVPSVPIG